MAEPRDAELRGNVPRSFLQKLDACAQADGMGRLEWLIPVLEREMDRRIHAATLLVRMAGVHPNGSDRGAE